MSEIIKLMDFAGLVDYDVIDELLHQLKVKEEFASLNKVTAKRTYAIVVECLENIAKYSVTVSPHDKKKLPRIYVVKKNGQIVIKTGNPVTYKSAAEIKNKLDQVNVLDAETLNALFVKEISKEARQKEQGAGLGFIMMKLRSLQRIDFSFTPINSDITYFELTISVNE